MFIKKQREGQWFYQLLWKFKVLIMFKSNNFDDKFLARVKFCFIFFTVIFLVIFSLIYFYNFFLFVVLSPFVLSCYVYLSIVCLKFLRKKDLMFKQLFFDFKLKDKEDFEKFPVPLMACSKKGLTLQNK